MRNNLSFDEFDLKLKDYAKEHKVPIILDEGLSFLLMLIKAHGAKNILEIGSAIGYSSIKMVKETGASIITLERNIDMYNEAVKNIKDANLEDKIRVIHKDAFDAYEELKNSKFDIIFIDAAKAQYQRFFETYETLLNDKGIIICDNMDFHNLKEDDMNLSRSVRGLVRKLSNFEEWLLNNKNYDTSIYSIGDGVSVSIKKG